MKRIEYKATFGPEARDVIVVVYARDITSGFAKALKAARSNKMSDENLHSVEFWMVTS